MPNLDLYAKIEPLIGFYEAYEELYSLYLSKLKKLNISHFLDAGCGNGRFLEIAKEHKIDALGIDLSSKMIDIAKAKGVDARQVELKELRREYECICAIADVLNYMDRDGLKIFLEDVKVRLKNGGYFLFDINSLHGFKDVAEGSFINSSSNYTLAIDAVFEEGKLLTHIDYFERLGESYIREQADIEQFYHSIKDIEALWGAKALSTKPISLFSTKSDKLMVVLQKPKK